MQRLSRRQFTLGSAAAALGLLAACARLPGQAEPAPRVARIGVLSVSADPNDADNAAFRQGLRDLGYLEGQNVTLEWRPFGSRIDQLPELTAELVGLPVDVIVAHGGTAIQTAKQASTTIPIVMAYITDPVGAGIVDSLARPGGNVTGLAALTGQLAPKRLELLRDTLPGLTRVAMLWNPGTAQRDLEFEEAAAAAQALGLGTLQSVPLRDGAGLEAAFESIRQERAEALFVQGTVINTRYRQEIVALSTALRLPTIVTRREDVAAGALMSYGPSYPDMNRRAAYYVDRILKGTRPADLPVEQPMTFEFAVNLKTARELGITFPPEILLQATEVIR